VNASGNSVSLGMTITFAPSFTGTKNIWVNTVSTSGAEGSWEQVGTWKP
jgi:hypothetical protein